MNRLTWLGRTALFALGALVSACTIDATGLSYASVTLSATNVAGESTQGKCTTLPILRGSHELNNVDFDGQFQARVFASSTDVEISFRGVQDAGALRRVLSAEELEGGYAESLDVVAQNGQTFEVLIKSGCSE
ncbi:MAG: hypothetical protein H6718_35375 [Polyangiaceae bacterium]|nr:hypothetical protein [Myxococcales bacterium]MCB9590743.1 hypothetical protein [Polyangiaceae bacterium]